MRALRVPTALFLVTIVACGAVLAQRAVDSVIKTYPVRFVDPIDLIPLLRAEIPEFQDTRSYEVRADRAQSPSAIGATGFVHIDAPPPLQTRAAAALAKLDVPVPTLDFHLVLLEASRTSAGAPELPEREMRALDDFRKVMPYRGFRLMQETSISSSGRTQVQLGGEWEVNLQFRRPRPGDAPVQVESFSVRSMKPKPGPAGAVFYETPIDTNFTIRLGETLVLGASSSDSSALVVLVTARSRS